MVLWYYGVNMVLLVHIDINESNDIMRIWLELPDSSKIDKKIRFKISLYVQSNKINKIAVPISSDEHRSSLLITTKQLLSNYFLVISACLSINLLIIYNLKEDIFINLSLIEQEFQRRIFRMNIDYLKV